MELKDYSIEKLKAELKRRVEPIEMTTDEHWKDVRECAAIAAMQGMLSNPAKYLAEGDTYPKVAVRYADALIEELKNK